MGIFNVWRKKKRNEDFLSQLRHVAMEHARQLPVTIDRLREIASSLGLHPSHPNVWGTVFRARGFYKVGTLPSTYPTNRKRAVTAWRYKDGRA